MPRNSGAPIGIQTGRSATRSVEIDAPRPAEYSGRVVRARLAVAGRPSEQERVPVVCAGGAIPSSVRGGRTRRTHGER
jgi:hypothetical protein